MKQKTGKQEVMDRHEVSKRVAAIWVKGHGLNENDFILSIQDIQLAIYEEVKKIKEGNDTWV